MARREEIQIFSLSLLDLLFCAMAAVTILWVLTGRGEPPQAKQQYGFVTVSQVGYWHLSAVQITDRNSGAVVLDVDRDRISEADSRSAFKDELTAKAEDLRARGLLLTLVSPKTSAGPGTTAPTFAGKLIMSASEGGDSFRVRVEFEMCPNRVALHTISVNVMSEDGTEQDFLLFHEEGAYQAARAHVGTIGRPPGERRVGGAGTANRVALEFDVDSGNIAYKRPNSL